MAAAVPEPEAMGLALVGLIMVGALRRRQAA
jgi:MYXO-CTERM domain-containing protein